VFGQTPSSSTELLQSQTPVSGLGFPEANKSRELTGNRERLKPDQTDINSP